MAGGKISTKPYLIRALHEWCTDQGFTPYLHVFVDEHVVVPRQYVKNSEIVLNVAWKVAHQLVLGNSEISFQTRFGGIVHDIWVPIRNVSGLFARETGQGLAFEDAYAPSEETEQPPTRSNSRTSSSVNKSGVGRSGTTKPPRKIKLQPGSVRHAVALAEAKAKTAKQEDASVTAASVDNKDGQAVQDGQKKTSRAHLTIIRN